jgi:hypothetical protein
VAVVVVEVVAAPVRLVCPFCQGRPLGRKGTAERLLAVLLAVPVPVPVAVPAVVPAVVPAPPGRSWQAPKRASLWLSATG